jgi:hypothetical protein
MVDNLKMFILILVGAGMVSACASSRDGSHKNHQNSVRILYSPNGEPLNGGPLGRPACQDAMNHWFDRVNVSHTGAISRDEFLADARQQFQRMDIDKNGYLVPEELDRFRRPYRQSSGADVSVTATDDDQASQPTPSSYGAHRHRRGSMGGGANAGNGAGASGQDNGAVVDPVMSADTNLDNRVTLSEFMFYAQKTFPALDSDHNGSLSSSEIQNLCPPSM